jgi:YD repeat-containing protein
VNLTSSGSFNQSLQSQPLSDGSQQATFTLVDKAGNIIQTPVTFQVDASQFTTGPTGTTGWSAENSTTVVLGEQDSYVTESTLEIPLGQTEGSRTLTFDLEASFDNSDTTSFTQDQVLIYLEDPTDPNQTLLNDGQEGTALFSLTSKGADYTAGLVRYDGKTVEIDLTSLAALSGGRLVIQLVNGDTDTDSYVQVKNLSNTVDPQGMANPVFPTTEDVFQAGEAVDLTPLTAAPYVQVSFTNVRLDPETGLYVADVQVKNTGPTTSSQVVVVFSGLTNGVTLLNPSGYDSNGNPYISMTPAIASGGLDRGALSGLVQVTFSDPSLLRFNVQPQVLVFTTNRAPTFEVADTLTVTPGETLSLPLVATDADGDPITFEIEADGTLPTGSLDGSGNLIFKPTPAEIGTYTFTLIATDGGVETRQAVTLNVVPDPVTTTRISGVIQDTNQVPLVGIPIETGGVRTVTAADGSFQLAFSGALPSDVLIVHGEDLSGPLVYPYIAEKLPLLFGHDPYLGFNNVIARPIYLPALDVANGQRVNPNQNVTVTTATIPGASVYVAAGSLQEQDGDPFTGILSITEVPVDFTPASLPPNLFPDLVVTIQPGEMVFTTPAPLSLPNRAGFAPGTLMDLWSINPTTGQFDRVGVGEVSADGSVVNTISGGIRNSSWHFFAPFPPPPPPPVPGPEDGCDECKETGEWNSEVELDTGAVIETYNLVTYESSGQTQGLTLRYDSLDADPSPIIHFGYDIGLATFEVMMATLVVKQGNFEYRISGAAPGQYSELGGEHFWTLSGGSIDAALQADLSSFATGQFTYELTIGLGIVDDTGDFFGSSVTTQNTLVNVNQTESAFGSGWSLAGLQQLYENADGTILILDGDGSELIFDPSTTPGLYNSRSNEFSTLERLVDGTYRHITKDETVYQFNAQKRLESITDRNGLTARYVYNGAGQIAEIIDAAGLVTQFTYTGNRVSAITDPAGRITQLLYDDAGNLIRIVAPDGSQRQWEYDREHHLIATIDELGQRSEDYYDFAGRAYKAIRPDGTVVQVAPYETQGLYRPEETINSLSAPSVQTVNNWGIREASYANPNGNVTLTVIDSQGQAISAIDGSGPLPTTTRNSSTNLVTETTDARGNTTSYTYDAQGNVIAVEDEVSGSGTGDGGGNGESTYLTSAFQLGSDNTPFDQELVDVNGDQVPDLVVATNQDALSILFGDSTGQFDAPILLLTGHSRSETVEVADVNNDGKLDLISADTDTISVLLGNGLGGFSSVIESLTSSGEPPDFRGAVLAVEDFDRDGDLDLAIAVTVGNGYGTDSGSVEILTGDGTGSFTPESTHSIGLTPKDIVAEDVNNDGIPDVIVVNTSAEDITSPGSIDVFLGNGNGSLTRHATYSVPPLQQDIDLADINNDGKLDLVIAGDLGTYSDEEGGIVSILLGDGLGNFGARTDIVIGESLSSIALGDVNGDNQLDLLAAGRPTAVTVLLGNGVGGFDSQNPVEVQFSNNVTAIEVADLNFDNQLDFVAIGSGSIGTDYGAIATVGLNQRQVEENPDGVGPKQYTYDPVFNQVTSETDELGRTTLYEIDPVTGNVITQTQVVGAVGGSDDLVTRYTYTTYGLVDTMTDPLGRMTDYDYDALGRLVKLTYAKGTADEAIERYEYDAAGNRTALIDANGNRTIYQYDALNRLVREIQADPDGTGPLTSPITTYTYDAKGQQIAVNDANNHTTRSEYDVRGRLVKTIDALGGITLNRYDTAGNLIATVDPLGRETRYRYDARNRLVATLYPDEATEKSGYDTDNNLKFKIDANGNVTNFVYDSRGRLVRQLDALGNVKQFEYDATNQLIATVDENGNRTQYQFDELGRQIAVINALGGTRTTIYDKNGNMLSETDELNHTTSYTYDSRDRRTTVTDALGAITLTTYDKVGNVLTSVDALNRTTTYQYDALNRQIATVDALNQTSTTAYDPVGNVTAQTDPLNRTTRFSYDALNRRITVTDPLNQTTTTAYDAIGNVVTMTDPLSHTTLYRYDDRDRRIQITDALGQITRMSYDKVGNLLSLSDPVNNRTTYRYDGLNRKTAETNALGLSRTFQYDKVGNLIQTTDRNSRVTTFTYDQLNRQTQEQWVSNSGTTVNTIGYTYDAASRLLTASDSDSRSTFTYDAVNRLVSVDNLGTTSFPRVVLDYSYDVVGNRTRTTDSINGTQRGTTTYTYDGINRTTQISQTGVSVANKRVTMSYDAASQLTGITRNGGMMATQLVATSAYSYDAAGRLTGSNHTRSTTTLASYTYTYDAANRLTRMVNADGTNNYTYDDTNQLETASLTAEDYSYDANGNRTNPGYVTGVDNRLLSDGTFNYEYDNEGNRTKRTNIATGEVTEYSWDHHNQLTQVITKNSSGAVTKNIQYSYDAFGKRIAKLIDSNGAGSNAPTTERLIYDGDNIVLSFDGNNAQTHRYLHSPGVDQVLADEVSTTNVLWALSDHQGTVRDVVNNAGTVVNHLRYDSFGKVTGQTSTTVSFRYGFTGRENDTETGLNYYRARYQDPRHGAVCSAG